MRLAHIRAILFILILTGCSVEQPPLTPRAPHGGMLLELPDELGSIEIVRQAVADKPGVTRLLIFSMDKERKPIASSPTAATLKTRGRGAKPIDFKPSSDTDPSRSGALESPDLPDRGDIDGELSMTLNGKPVSLTVSVR